METKQLTIICCDACGGERYRANGDKIAQISCSGDAYRLFGAAGANRVESFDVVALNTRNVVVHRERIAKGAINSVHISISEVLRPAVITSSPSILCIHNHPSGDPTPSTEDRELTKRISKACSLMGIKLLDHVIIADGSYYSFADAGGIS